MKRRNGLEVTRDILKVCMEGASKTRIVYRANLNAERLTTRLEALLWMGLVRANQDDGGRASYKTTVQGVRFLEGYFAERIGKRIEP